MGPVIVSGRLPALWENRYGPFLMRGSDAMTSCAADDNGTKCSRALPSRPFILDAGMVITLPWTSGHESVLSKPQCFRIGKWNVEVSSSVNLKMRTKIEEDSAMATYSIDDLSRREILKMSAILGVTSVVSTKFAFAQAALLRTPGQILGPFYPMKPFDQNADLTKVPGRSGRAEGEILNVMGRVLNLKGEPVRNAKVEVWQANAHGRYTHPSDTNPAPLDPNFEGSAALTTDSEGRYRFKTIKPAAYPVGPNTIRPAHIHFEVYGQQDRLVTQMYFEGDPYNSTDRFLQSAGRTELLITKLLPPPPEFEPESKLVVFDIVVYAG